MRDLITCQSPSGFEQEVQHVIRERVGLYSDELHTDVHGNVIAALNPDATPRVMLTAHCDEIGFLVRYIDEQGFLYFGKIGGFDASSLIGERVRLHTPHGTTLGVIARPPIHLLGDDERGKAPKINDLWIDIGASSREEAQKLAPIGSFATRDITLESMPNNIVVARALDDRAGIFAVVEAMRRIFARRSELTAGVYFVSAVQEEVGSRGATTSAFGVDPLIAIAVDVTYTSDHPQTSKQEIGDVRLNGGPVITLGSGINPRVYERLIAAAAAEIAVQLDPQSSLTYTDSDAIQIARAGVATGLISIPCRYLHTRSEMVSLSDIDQVAEVLTRFVLALDATTNVIP